MAASAAVGARIRALRQRQGRTLADIAKACRFTPSLLSKIETGASSPPVATLSAIAAALGVPVAGLLGADGLPADAVLDAAAGRRIDQATDKGYRFAALAAARGGAQMTPYLFTAARGEVKPGPLSHPGEELVLVLDGELRFRVGAATWHLRQGDLLAFDAAVDHDMEPISERATWFAVFCAPPAKPSKPRPRKP